MCQISCAANSFQQVEYKIELHGRAVLHGQMVLYIITPSLKHFHRWESGKIATQPIQNKHVVLRLHFINFAFTFLGSEKLLQWVHCKLFSQVASSTVRAESYLRSSEHGIKYALENT